MKQYYINNGRQREGPFLFEELRTKGIRRETLVWQEGYADWMAAGDVVELEELVKTNAPVFKSFGIDTAIRSEYKLKERKENFVAVVWTIVLITILTAAILFFASRREKQVNYQDESTTGYSI